MKTQTEVKHTEGPWKVERLQNKEGGKYMCITAKDDINLANIVFQLDDSELANARLIAAAPELLKAAKLALSMIEQMARQGVIGKNSDYYYQTLNRAVAQAEGR